MRSISVNFLLKPLHDATFRILHFILHFAFCIWYFVSLGVKAFGGIVYYYGGHQLHMVGDLRGLNEMMT